MVDVGAQIHAGALFGGVGRKRLMTTIHNFNLHLTNTLLGAKLQNNPETAIFLLLKCVFTTKKL